MVSINDCLALLDYVSKHRDDPQTQESLSEVTGIPQRTISDILTDDMEESDSTLSRTAYKYGFEYRIFRGRMGRGDSYSRKRSHPQIIDVVYTGRGLEGDQWSPW